jgi:hypothetical protein
MLPPPTLRPFNAAVKMRRRCLSLAALPVGVARSPGPPATMRWSLVSPTLRRSSPPFFSQGPAPWFYDLPVRPAPRCCHGCCQTASSRIPRGSLTWPCPGVSRRRMTYHVLTINRLCCCTSLLYDLTTDQRWVGRLQPATAVHGFMTVAGTVGARLPLCGLGARAVIFEWLADSLLANQVLPTACDLQRRQHCCRIRQLTAQEAALPAAEQDTRR